MALAQEQFFEAINTASPLDFLKRLSGLSELRKLCEASIEAYPNIEPLESFVIVGGTYLKHIEERPFHNGHGNRDSRALCEIVFYCLRSGIPVSPKFTSRMANFLNRQDYLKTTYESDVVILGHLPDDHFPESLTAPVPNKFDAKNPFFRLIIKAFHKAVRARRYKEADDLANGMALVSSPDATPERWGQRITDSRAKLIFSANWQRALSVSRLELPNHRALLPEVPHRHAILAYDIKGFMPNEREVGWEIAVDDKFQREAGPHVSRKTLLGNDMHAALPEPPAPKKQPRRKRDRDHGKT